MTLTEREAFDWALMCARSMLETRGGWARVYGAWARWIELARALAAARAIRKFLGGLLHGEWHISQAVRHSLSQGEDWYDPRYTFRNGQHLDGGRASVDDRLAHK